MYWRISIYVIIVVVSSACTKKLTIVELSSDQTVIYDDIRQSILVVRIPTQGRKIRVLKEKLKTTTNSNASASIKSAIQVAQKEDNDFSKELIGAFREYYTFTPFVFVADTLFQRFLDGDNTVFLEKKGIQIEIKDFNRDKYYLVMQGAQKEQLRFVDKYYQPTSVVPVYRHIFGKIAELRNRKRFLEKQVFYFESNLRHIESLKI